MYDTELSFLTRRMYYYHQFLGLIVPLDNFHSFGDVTITAEGLQILTFARGTYDH